MITPSFLEFADILEASPRFIAPQRSVAGRFILDSLNRLLPSDKQLIPPHTSRCDQGGQWRYILGVLSAIVNKQSPGAGRDGQEATQSDIDYALAWGSHYLGNDSLVISGQNSQTGMFSDWTFNVSMLVPQSVDERCINPLIYKTVEFLQSREKHNDLAFLKYMSSSPQQLSYWNVPLEGYSFTQVSFVLRSHLNLDRNTFDWVFTGLCRDRGINLSIIRTSIDGYDAGGKNYPWTAHQKKPDSLRGLSGVEDTLSGYWKSVFPDPEWRSLGTVIHELYHIKLQHIIPSPSSPASDSLQFEQYEPLAVAGALRAFIAFDKQSTHK